MTDHHDEMRVEPDAVLAEELRLRLHALMASAMFDDDEGRSHPQLDAARLEPEQHLVPVKENYVSIDSPPASQTRNHRRMAVAAAAVVAVLGVAAIAINRMNSEDNVDPATAAPPTVAPIAVAPTTGTDTVSGVRFTFAVPAGWQDNGWYVSKANSDPIIAVIFFDVANIFTDPCQWVTVDPPVGPTVDDLAAAWANVPSVNATAATDITVDGFRGKQIEFTVPDYNENECKDNKFGLYLAHGNAGGTGPDYWAQGPNQHHQLRILDVNGTRLVITASDFPDTSQQDRAAIDEILASIQIG